MFDVGFSEMIVIAIVALVVIGPERLPKVARTAGHLLGRLQRYVSNVKADIHREMQLEELRKLQSEIQESARSVEQSLTTEIEAARQAVQQTAQAVGDGLPPDLAQEWPNAPQLPVTPAAAPAAAAADEATVVDQPTRPT
ncbi:MAG TPA: Sec-independent protein translocase protein TatB [Accumulibacter sp.]|uniref:Sec-independent protein translocase protein TatB n=1 Tax=Accumulibacter sp. TaxID=2053492 RepID=UPI0025E3046B|nr:Sec-independent protein translocase protein TatB [Accumulibacter sp.]MCM8599640.1 Sec-independent protein translocase protein TatB [Accumulibacter sp.]MCM8663299.1 Sec-independent protein translocase protein TatB [Accumulibacter sp.]HNC50727.1 Sec-independent protein translocase protein TatB [Accumulibacter sp.]